MGSNLRDFLEGRLLWFGELVLCGSGPWIIRWLGRLLLRLDQRSVLHAGVGGGLGDLDGGVTDGGAEIVHVELVAASPLPRLGLPVALHVSSADYDPGALADAGGDHMVRQDAVGYAADERGLAVLPFAVLLGDAGLGYAEVDDGPAACRALGFEIGDEIAHEGHGNLVDCRHDWSFLSNCGPCGGLILLTSSYVDIPCAHSVPCLFSEFGLLLGGLWLFAPRRAFRARGLSPGLCL